MKFCILCKKPSIVEVLVGCKRFTALAPANIPIFFQAPFCPCVIIGARTKEYSQKRYFRFAAPPCGNINVVFETPVTPASYNIISLKDATYDLPINGVLRLKS